MHSTVEPHLYDPRLTTYITEFPDKWISIFFVIENGYLCPDKEIFLISEASQYLLYLEQQ